MNDGEIPCSSYSLKFISLHDIVNYYPSAAFSPNCDDSTFIHRYSLHELFVRNLFTLVAEYAAPVGVASAIPRGAVAVAMFAARVRLALRAEIATPARSAAGEDKNSL